MGSWVERVELRRGTRHLCVATPIPVVFAKCTVCHNNYENVKKGQPIGGAGVYSSGRSARLNSRQSGGRGLATRRVTALRLSEPQCSPDLTTRRVVDHCFSTGCQVIRPPQSAPRLCDLVAQPWPELLRPRPCNQRLPDTEERIRRCFDQSLAIPPA